MGSKRLHCGSYGRAVNEIVQIVVCAFAGHIPILLWNNNCLGAIEADMIHKDIQPTAVTIRNPDFQLLAKAWGCGAEQPATLDALTQAVHQALQADGPTLIEMTPDMAEAG